MDSWSLGRRERYQRGTGSSNPSLSKGESCANLHAGGAGPDGGDSDLAQGHAGKNARLSPGTPITATKPVAPARRHGRPPTTTAKSAGSKHSSSNLGDQVLALATGKTQQEIAAACKGARANHVGAALSRHKRTGRIEERDGKLYAISQLLRDEVRAILAHRKGCRIDPDLSCSCDPKGVAGFRWATGVARVTDKLKHSVIGIVKVSAQAFHACRQALSTSTRNGWSST